MASHTGIGRYIRTLVKAFADSGVSEFRMVVALNPEQDADFIPESDSVSVFRYRRHIEIYRPAEHIIMPGELKRTGADIVHFPHFAGPWTCPLPKVVTIHDITYIRFPEVAPSRLMAMYAAALLGHAAGSAKVVLTTTDHATNDVIQNLGLPPDRIITSPLTVCDFQEMLTSLPPGKPPPPLDKPPGYILYVGNHLPHKNLPRLIRAFALVRDMLPDCRLALVGRKGRNTPELETEISRAELGDCVHILGHVSEDELAACYRNARLFVFPSLMEGFGLPLLEAFAAGVPVAASNVGPLPEVGGDAFIGFNPESEPEIAGAIIAALKSEDIRRQLVSRGRARLEQFTPKRMLEGTLRAYRAACRRRNL